MTLQKVYVVVTNDREGASRPDVLVFASEESALLDAGAFIKDCMEKEFSHFLWDRLTRERPELTSWYKDVMQMLAHHDISKAIETFNDYKYNEMVEIEIQEREVRS